MYEPQFKCKRNGVPILSHEDIESDAEMFLRDFDPEALENPKEVLYGYDGLQFGMTVTDLSFT